MINVSETYNPYTTIRDVNMIVKFDAINEAASTYAQYNSVDIADVANLTQLNNLDYTDVNYATCENGLVMLDGTWDYLPDTLTDEQIGWWTYSISNATGEFATNPVIDIDVGQTVSCVGFTLYTANSNPIKECIVTTYANNQVIYKEIFTRDDNSNKSSFVIDLPTNNFDSLDIEVTKTKNPYRRVKLSAFAFGITKIWDRNNIVEAHVDEEADITGNSLPINELTVEFDNSTGEFDLFGTTQKYVYRQAVKDVAIISNDIYGNLANIDQVVDENTALFNYATCENGLVMLDGTWDYLPHPITPDYQIGYINGTLSDENGDFETPPLLDFEWEDFSAVSSVDISGIRIYFGRENYATSITVTGYSHGIIVNSETFSNTENIVELPFAADACDSVVIKFNSTAKPNRFIKVSDVQFLKYADSWGSYLTKNQHLTAEFIINGEPVSLGKTYLFDRLEQKNGGLTAEIVAKDYVSHLDTQTFTHGAHGTTTLGEALSDIWQNSNVTIEYSPASLSSTTVSRAAPKGTSKRAATHYFVQASKATCYLSREGILKVKTFDISPPYVDTFNATNMYDNDVAKMSDYVNMVRLSVNDEYTDPPTEERYYGGSGYYYREIENNCVYSGNGTAVATWILQQYQRRIYFELETRGNPAIELGDTIRIITKDGTAYVAVVYNQKFEYDGLLKSTIKAVVGID